MQKSRIIKDKTAQAIMFGLTIVSILMVVVMFVGLYLKSAPVLEDRSLWGLLTSSEWKPMKGEFGFSPFVAGTLWVTFVAIFLALPISLLTAVFLTEYAKSYVKKFVFPALDILAALPSVIYGVWGVLVIVPWISKHIAPHFMDFSTGYTVLAAGIVLGVIIAIIRSTHDKTIEETKPGPGRVILQSMPITAFAGTIASVLPSSK